MTYDLYIGWRTYSSWSLRGWLMFEKFGIPCRTHLVDLFGAPLADQMTDLAPARLVPAMRTPDGIVIGESLAMAETLAERHPDAGLWPADPAARARARWLTAEMHAGFTALRGECPFQCLHQYQGFAVSAAVRADLNRLDTIWDTARQTCPSDGPWLFGAYSLADVFFAPVAIRIAGYGLPVSVHAAAYVDRHLNDPAIQAWRAAAQTENISNPVPYTLDLPTLPWPSAVRPAD